jgi:hypothetical protein
MKKYKKLSDFPEEMQKQARLWAEQQYEENKLDRAVNGGKGCNYALDPLPKKPKLDPATAESIKVGEKSLPRVTMNVDFLLDSLKEYSRELRENGATEIYFNPYRVALIGYRKPMKQELEDAFQQKYDEALQHRARVYAARELKDKLDKEATKIGGAEEDLKAALKANPDWIVEEVFRQYRMGKLK